MLTSRKHTVSIFMLSILFQCASPAPQYSDDTNFNPPYHKTEENAMNLRDSGVARNPYQQNDQGNYFLSDRWFAVNALPTQENSATFWPPEVAESLTPPVYAESQFNAATAEPEYQPLSADIDFQNQFQRGRSDIDPEDDDEGFPGYFYPKPKIPFDLPDFKPVNIASDMGASAEDVTAATTTANSQEESVEKTTTSLTAGSSTAPSDKV